MKVNLGFLPSPAPASPGLKWSRRWLARLVVILEVLSLVVIGKFMMV